MSNHERQIGLYYPDGSFKSEQRIKRDLALRGELPQMVHHTPIRLPRDVDEYLDEAEQMARLRREQEPQSEHFVELTLPRTSIISLWGDLHMFHNETDHARIRQELAVIRNTGDSFLVLGADLTDGIHWGGESGGEQVGSLTHQVRTMKALFEAVNGRVLVGVSGEHDSKWAQRTGADPYLDFSTATGAPYVKGIGEILIHCGGQDYKMVVQHKARGHSMYNKNHPTFREARFDLQEADIYVSFHTHQKQVAQETIRHFGGSRIVTHISGGAYKRTDSYGARSGFAVLDPKEMFGASIRLHADEHRVDVNYDILQAHREWAE